MCTPTANYVEANGKYYRRYEGTDATSAVEAVDRCAEDGAYLALFKTESDFLVARDYNRKSCHREACQCSCVSTCCTYERFKNM